MSDPNAGVIQILKRTLPWVRVVTIVGFLAVGFVAVLGIVSWIGIATDRFETVPLRALVVYPVLFLLYLFPSLYLYKYARRIHVFVAQGHMVQLEAALEAQRALWKFVGVLFLAIAGLTGLLVLAAIVIGVTAGL